MITSTLTKKQKETIADNLRAFEHNFGECRIEQYMRGEGFYVYYPKERYDTEGFHVYYPKERHNTEDYIQYCYNIAYLDGWLYGCVQGAVRGEFKPYRTGGLKE